MSVAQPQIYVSILYIQVVIGVLTDTIRVGIAPNPLIWIIMGPNLTPFCLHSSIPPNTSIASNCSFSFIFGGRGRFFNGQRTVLYNDLCMSHAKEEFFGGKRLVSYFKDDPNIPLTRTRTWTRIG